MTKIGLKTKMKILKLFKSCQPLRLSSSIIVPTSHVSNCTYTPPHIPSPPRYSAGTSPRESPERIRQFHLLPLHTTRAKSLKHSCRVREIMSARVREESSSSSSRERSLYLFYSLTASKREREKEIEKGKLSLESPKLDFNI